jgi:ribonuclease Z
MAELVVLGSAASIPDAQHDTIGLLLRGADGAILIDCGGSPLHKLARLGVEPGDVQAVVLTHRHADHLYGLPMLVQGLWLDGRTDVLPAHGSAETLEVARELLELFDLAERPDMFPLSWQAVPLLESQPVLHTEDVRIIASPVIHGNVGTIGLRLENIATGRTIVYSADTEPCSTLVRLSQGADLLIHEATGDDPGHSSPREASLLAREAAVGRLVLIHYPVRGVDLEEWRSAASEFSGPIDLACDGDVYPL